MTKKFVGIFIMMLLIATAVPAAESLNISETNSISYTPKQGGTRDDWTEIQNLLASDGAAGDQFGISVSLSENTALIGAAYDDSYKGSAYVFTRTGTTWTQQQKLLALDGAAGDGFGVSVSLSGDTALIGAFYDDNNGANSGSAYVFTRTGTTWSQQAKLLASDGATGDQFGISVSLSGNTALIGAAWDDNARGSAYVFTRTGTTWTQQAKLLASDGAAGDWFGSVALYGDTALIGACGDDPNGANSGSAYVFINANTSVDLWNLVKKLNASDGAAGDKFGWSVSLYGDYALIGAYQDDDNGIDSGSAYVFYRGGASWTQQAKLLPSDGAAGDWFGRSVSIICDYALIGAPQDDDKGTDSGSAYVFYRNGTRWTQQAKLLAPDGAPYDHFGCSVSIICDHALIGAPDDDDNGIDSGSAYVFYRGGTIWTLQAKLLAPDGAAGDNFGRSVSIICDYALIGAPRDDDKGIDSGSAYVRYRNGSSWIPQAKLLALDGAPYDHFGCNVSIICGYALIGDDSDSAYVFYRNGFIWTQQAKLLPLDGAKGFGRSVSIICDYALIGAPLDDVNGTNSGSAYVFYRNGTSWTQQAKLLPSDGAAGKVFGCSVSIYDDKALIGAPGSESAYIFKRGRNQPPNKPTIDGPTSGNPGTPYYYTLNAVDPDDDNVRYIIEWGDGKSNTTDFYLSGTDVIVTHTWDGEGTYIIKVRAEDSNGLVGPEATLSVTMPTNKISGNTLLERFIQNHPNLFLILQKIFQRVGQ